MEGRGQGGGEGRMPEAAGVGGGEVAPEAVGVGGREVVRVECLIGVRWWGEPGGRGGQGRSQAVARVGPK